MSDKKSEKKDNFEPFDAVSHIADIVNKSIASGDYASLNREITSALNEAADAVHDSLSDVPFFQRDGGKTYRAQSKSNFEDAQKKASKPESYYKAKRAVMGSDGVVSPVGAYVRAIIGTGATIFFASLFAGGLAVDGFGPFSLFFGAITAFCGWNMFKGFKKIGMINRARKILQMMENRDTITLTEIASAFGKSEKWVADDIQAMIREGIFAGKTYMDKEETAFMTSHAAYNLYVETMKAYESRRAKEAASSVFNEKDLKEYRKMEQNAANLERDKVRAAAQLDKETAEMVEEGKAFINHIHKVNEEVPGKEFTEKVNRLEVIVTNIFDRVAADPKSAPDLHKLMKYYLPTTQKLLDTYATLDKQTVQGENIENAKREIEASLDTINAAFEKFLDSFFQSTAWDVSSDITVMNQMMSQDGLTGGNDFDRAAAAAQAASKAEVNAAQRGTTGQAGAGVAAGQTAGSQAAAGQAAGNQAAGQAVYGQPSGKVKVKTVGGAQVLVQEEEE